MRIKNLKVKNHGSIKEINVRFSDQENIIFVVEPYDEKTEEIPFGDSFMDLIQFLFFNDSYAYAKNCARENTLMECTVEKDGAEYAFGMKGDYRRTVKDGKVCLRNVLDWFCIIPEGLIKDKNGGWLEAQLCCEPQEYFYPKALEGVSRFDKDAYADSPNDFVYEEVLSWLKLMAKYNKRNVYVEGKLKELIDNFNEMKINELASVGVNEEKDYVLLFGGEESTEQKDLELVNFCGWINNLNILKSLCEFVGEDGSLPIFIDSVFDGDLVEYKDVLIEKLRETGRQVFVHLRNRDENVEKYCDKVIEIK